MITLLLLILLTSCSFSEVLEQPLPRTKSDTTYTPRTKDTTNTSFVPIEFEVGVEEWEDVETEINL